MNKNLKIFAVYLAFGIICCVLLWRPWAPNEASFGFKSADEEMRALLQRQTEERDQGSGKESAAKTAIGKSASSKETQAKNGQSLTANTKGMTAQNEQSQPSDAVEMPAENAQANPADVKATAAPQVKLNLNSATVKQLDALPGVGESRAQAIVALRQKLGGKFASVNQLLEVKGIGEKMLEKIAPLVTVEP